jgi:hypothetical protein
MADENPTMMKDNLINEATLDASETRIYSDSKKFFAEVKHWMETESRPEP